MIKKQLCIIILFFTPLLIFAHPHVFIENSFIFVFDDTGLSGIQVKWIFDEMFSASIIMDFDSNKDKVLNDKEIKSIKEGAFSNLASYDYFLHIKINEIEYRIKAVTNFKAEIMKNKLVYCFFVPLNLKAIQTDQVITAGSYDDTYFCYIFYSETEPVKVENNPGIVNSWEIIDDKKNAYWGGTIIPKIVKLIFRYKDD